MIRRESPKTKKQRDCKFTYRLERYINPKKQNQKKQNTERKNEPYKWDCSSPKGVLVSLWQMGLILRYGRGSETMWKGETKHAESV